MSVEKVRAYLEPYGVADRIREFDVSSATVELAALAVGVEGARIAKTLSFKVDEEPILVVAAGDAKVDNSKYKHFFGAKAKMLTAEEAVERIGHAVGGVCPFALPDDVKTYLDVSLKRFETVFPAVGSAASAIELTCDELEDIPRYETALLYPGTCLIEGTNCSEGRGTADPFAIIGAPFIKAEAFSRAFNALGCPGVESTPVYFSPTTSKHEGTLCGGIHLHITDETLLQPVALGVKLLDLLRKMYPEDFHFLPPVREDGKPFLSLLAGHRDFEHPDWDAESLLARYRKESEDFRQRKAPYERYPRG